MDRRDGGHRFTGVGLAQELVELAGPPAPRLSELQDLANHRGRGGMRTWLRSVRAIGQALRAEAGIAVEPLVAGLAADGVAPSQLGEGSGGVLGIKDETLALVHG